jgi:hypothetical protein
MKLSLPWMLVGVLVSLLGASLIRLNDERSDARRAREQAEALKSRADIGRANAEMWEQMYRAASVEASEIAQRAAKRDTVVRTRLVEIRAEPVPDTCRRLVAQRDSVINTLLVTATTWNEAFTKQKAATALLQRENEALFASNIALDSAYRLLHRPPRRSLLGRLVRPSMRPGAFVGVCTDGKPCSGIGATLTWGL